MKRSILRLLAAAMALALATSVFAGSIAIKVQDGSRWRGDLNDKISLTYMEQGNEVAFGGVLTKVTDYYVVITGDLGERTIMRGDIVSMKTATDEARGTGGLARTSAPKREVPKGAPLDASGNPMGVIVLPMAGFVGGPFRKEEIIAVGKKADELGPGQIIVLLVNSNGGSALESQYIADEIFELRKRHRVVAWIEKAISAGCQTAMCCQEIYFTTEGTAGAVTTWNPGSGQSIKGEDLKKSMEHLAELAVRSGYSPDIAASMKTNKAVCSYDKDEETGEVTFYPDKRGQYLLSDENSNLSFTSSTALHCGFSKGTADTPEELAKLLDLPRWYEVTDYGRKIAQDWQDTYKRAEEEVPRIGARLQYEGTIQNRISNIKQLVRWWDRCPNYMMYNGVPPKEELERELVRLRKALADSRR